MKDQTVVTWYTAGSRLPWRLAAEDERGNLYGEVRCETFHELMVELGETWGRVQPEPRAARPRSLRFS